MNTTEQDQINELLSIIADLITQRCTYKDYLVPIAPAECTAMQALERARIVEPVLSTDEGVVETGRWRFRASYLAAGE